MNKDHDRIVRERARDNSKLTKLIIAAPCNQVHMLRQSKLRVKSKSQITNCDGKGYVRKEQCKLGKIDTMKLPIRLPSQISCVLEGFKSSRLEAIQEERTSIVRHIWLTVATASAEWVWM